MFRNLQLMISPIYKPSNATHLIWCLTHSYQLQRYLVRPVEMSSSNILGTVNSTSASSSSSSLADVSSPRPSVFELLAEERLSSLIRPCLRQVFKFLHENRPLSHILQVLYKYKDEFILLIEGIVQWLYLNNYSALVGERFYGFKRTADHRLRSLLFSVFLPYVKAKLESLQDQMQTNNNTSNNRSRSFQIIFRILPKVLVFVEGLCWLYRLAYAFGKTEYYSPVLQLAGVKLAYAKAPTPTVTSTTFSSRFFSTISQVMSTGLFLIQFVDWWNNANGAKKKPPTTDTIPPVPRPVQTSSNIARRQCPLCRQPCNVPTAVVGSGYVYCNQCIVDYVQRYNRCPTTNQPVTTEQLIKVY